MIILKVVGFIIIYLILIVIILLVILYKGNHEAFFYCLDLEKYYETRYSIKSKMKRIDVEIICWCGWASFYLSYGDYEVIAKCVNCGKFETIYSG